MEIHVCYHSLWWLVMMGAAQGIFIYMTDLGSVSSYTSPEVAGIFQMVMLWPCGLCCANNTRLSSKMWSWSSAVIARSVSAAQHKALSLEQR